MGLGQSDAAEDDWAEWMQYVTDLADGRRHEDDDDDEDVDDAEG